MYFFSHFIYIKEWAVFKNKKWKCGLIIIYESKIVQPDSRDEKAFLRMHFNFQIVFFISTLPTICFPKKSHVFNSKSKISFSLTVSWTSNPEFQN